jgi:hypothetical protein
MESILFVLPTPILWLIFTGILILFPPSSAKVLVFLSIVEAVHDIRQIIFKTLSKGIFVKKN